MTTSTVFPASSALCVRKRSINKSKFHGWGLFRHYIALLVVFVVLVSPVFLPLLGAFKSSGDPIYGKGATAFPQHWSLNAFGELFRTTDIVRYIANLFAVCGLNIVSALVFSSVCGYMLSRKGWPGRGVVTAVALSALIFPFESIMLSLYSQVRSFGFYDTIIGIWPPGMIGPFHVLLMRAAFLGIPDEIEDAAYIDGAGEVRRFFTIFLPQVKGSLVVGLTAFIFAWQDYLWPLLITLHDDDRYRAAAVLIRNGLPNRARWRHYCRDPHLLGVLSLPALLLPWHRGRRTEVLSCATLTHPHNALMTFGTPMPFPRHKEVNHDRQC